MTPFLQERRVLRFYAAGFWRRAAGAVIDGTLVALVLTLLLWTMWGLSWPVHTEVQHFGIDFLLELLLGDAVAGLLAGLVLLILGQAYFVVLHSLHGQTIGQRLVGVRVVTQRGVTPGLLRSLARAWASLIGFVLLGVGIVWIGFDREKRGFADFLAGTYVVRGEGNARAPSSWALGAGAT